MRVFFSVPEHPERTYHTHTILGGTLLSRWRGLAARREVRSLRMVVAASLEEAAAAAAKKQVEARLAAESARLLAGLQLSSAAVLRGDGAKLQYIRPGRRRSDHARDAGGGAHKKQKK